MRLRLIAQFIQTIPVMRGSFAVASLLAAAVMSGHAMAQPTQPFTPVPSPYGGALASPDLTPPVGANSDNDFMTPEERVNVAVYESSYRAVVHIDARAVQTESFWGDSVTSEGSGSGSIWDEQGHILTNFHVVEGSQQVVVTLFDGNQYEAKVIGADPPNDIAVLKIEAPHDTLVPVRLGDSERLKVGQRVFAFGSPFGLERTMTCGIISSLNRTLPSRNHRTMKAIIQVDAALNRGNSGGPLMSSRGELVGMNTAIASATGENTGIGFAIPAATIRRLVPQLITNGRVIRPTIGIEAVAETQLGLLVAKVTPGGPADQAGIKGVQIVRKRRFYGEERRLDIGSADIIVAAGGKPVKKADDLLSLVEQGRAGQILEVVVSRQGTRVRLMVTLGDES